MISLSASSLEALAVDTPAFQQPEQSFAGAMGASLFFPLFFRDCLHSIRDRAGNG